MALPVVLLLLALLVASGTAFLTFALGGSRSTMAAAMQLRAESAASAALEEAGAILSSAIRHDAFLVLCTTGTPPYHFIGDAGPGVAGDPGILLTPLFSGGLATIGPPASSPFLRWDELATTAILRPFGEDAAASVRWIPLIEPDTGYTNARYAFWIEDLAAFLDADSVANKNGPQGTHRRGDGTNPNEIAAFTIFEPRAIADSTTQDDLLVDNRGRLPTAESLRGLFETSELSERFVANLGEDEEPDLIPFGHGYPDQGTGKADINALIHHRDIAGFIGHMRKNLPEFENRRGGMADPDEYLGTLAACIIDYADNDGDPTLHHTCRGIDNYPLLNEMFDRYAWVSGAGPAVNVEVTTYIELWNPTDKPATGTITFCNRNRHAIVINGHQEFSDAGPWTTRVALPPNGFEVLKFPKASYSFDTGRPVAAPLWFVETTASNYELQWNGVPVDTARGGLQRTAGSLRPGQGNRKWKGHSAPALDYSNGQYGDPRASSLVTAWIYANDYDRNSSWGGRNIRRGIRNPNYAEVDLTRWPDGGHNSSPGVAPGNDGTTPDSLTRPMAQPDLAPVHISNLGRLEQISELGHIFDSAQWASLHGDGVPSSTAAGGFTLRIGRPEFGAFDKAGMRARQLLDIFSVRRTRATRGLININTATRESLRALAAGLVFERDRVLAPPPGLPNRGAVEQGGAFADAVIASRPFLSTTELAAVTNQWGPFFGNTNQWPHDPPAFWNDSAAEECFARIHDLTCVRSRNFRVSVVAEALDVNGSCRATSRKVFQLFIRPDRDESGRLLHNTPEIRYAARY